MIHHLLLCYCEETEEHGFIQALNHRISDSFDAGHNESNVEHRANLNYEIAGMYGCIGNNYHYFV